MLLWISTLPPIAHSLIKLLNNELLVNAQLSALRQAWEKLHTEEDHWGDGKFAHHSGEWYEKEESVETILREIEITVDSVKILLDHPDQHYKTWIEQESGHEFERKLCKGEEIEFNQFSEQAIVAFLLEQLKQIPEIRDYQMQPDKNPVLHRRKYLPSRIIAIGEDIIPLTANLQLIVRLFPKQIETQLATLSFNLQVKDSDGAYESQYQQERIQYVSKAILSAQLMESIQKKDPQASASVIDIPVVLRSEEEVETMVKVIKASAASNVRISDQAIIMMDDQGKSQYTITFILDPRKHWCLRVEFSPEYQEQRRSEWQVILREKVVAATKLVLLAASPKQSFCLSDQDDLPRAPINTGYNVGIDPKDLAAYINDYLKEIMPEKLKQLTNMTGSRKPPSKIVFIDNKRQIVWRAELQYDHQDNRPTKYQIGAWALDANNQFLKLATHYDSIWAGETMYIKE